MSRQYRNTAQWLELIEAFEHSGQTQVEFCAALKLNPKYFSKRGINDVVIFTVVNSKYFPKIVQIAHILLNAPLNLTAAT